MTAVALSAAARRQLVLTALGGAEGTTLTMAVRLAGPLNLPALESAFGEVVARHAALRTAVVGAAGTPHGLVHGSAELRIRVVDLSGLVPPPADDELDRLLGAHVRRPFDRARPPGLRVDVAVLGPRRCVAVVAADHLAVDGWSLGVLASEVAAIYGAATTGRPAGLGPVPPGRPDGEARPDGDTAVDDAGRRWLDRVCAPSDDDVPGAVRHGTGPRGPAAVHRVVLPPSLSTRLDDACRREGATVFTAVLTAWAATLHRLDGRRATTVVTLTSGRTRPALEQVIAHLGNVLPIRVEIPAAATLGRLWRTVRDACADSLTHRDVPYEQVAQGRRRAGADPVPGVLCSGLAPTPELALPGVQATPIHAPPGAARFDLTIEVGPHRSGTRIALQYDSRALSPDSVQLLGRHLRAAVRQLCEQPSTPCARLELEPSTTMAPACTGAGSSMLHELFERQVVRSPDAVALSCAGAHLTYRALNRRANVIARGLRAAGVGPEDRVVVELPRGADAVSVQLAVLKAGAAWVPVDPDDPAPRRRRLVAQAGARCVVVGAGRRDGAGLAVPVLGVDELTCADRRADDLRLPAHPAQAAYLMFTSGSTGPSKAVVGVHASTVTRLRWMWTAHPYRPGERACLRAAPVFVDAVAELYGPLLAGVPVEIVPPEIGRDPDRLLALLRRAEISRLLVVPTLLAELLRRWPSGRGRPAALGLCVSSGERLPAATADRFAVAVGATLLNLYGSTEVAGDATAAVVGPGAQPSIGHAVAGARTAVRDRFGAVVPGLGTGELHVGGDLLARGYLGDPARTARRFRPDPGGPPGSRAFRTGDLVRAEPDGLVFTGRRDTQLKVRGVRVEPGEVEAVFLARPDVLEVAVCARWEGTSAAGLVAHVVPADGVAVDGLAAELRAHAATALPPGMVPTVAVAGGPLPRTATGKLDRRALDAAAPARPTPSPSPPTGPVEKAVAAAFDAVLPHPCRDAEDDFFALGGHSLMAAELLRRIEEELGVGLTLRELFGARTVRGVAAAVLGQPPIHAAAAIVPRPEDRHLPFPLTEVQLAYWVGRDRALPLGGVATHGYLEIAVDDLDLDRLDHAVNAVIERHPALRTVVRPSGEQQVLRSVPHYRVAVTTVDRSGDWTAALDRVRAEMSHQVLPADRWPLFDIRVTRRAHGASHLHVGLDALVADAHSAALLTDELAHLYRRPDLRLAPLAITFRDVVLARQAIRPEAQRHWRRRARELPDAPELPLVAGSGAAPVFRRRTATLDTASWRALQEGARRVGATPTVALLAAYSEVLRRWSRSPRFTLVLTLFHRPGTHPDLHRVVGDFTALVPLDVTRTGRPTVAEYARDLQLRLGDELDHDPAGGVAVLRERGAAGSGGGFPVVFTSTLGLPAVEDDLGPAPPLGRLVHGVSQTPQAYLDHQVGEGPDGLALNWDAVEDRFPPGVLDAMQADYLRLLTGLADGGIEWSQTVDGVLGERPVDELGDGAPDGRAGPVGDVTLPGLVRAAARRGPDRIAVVGGGVQITYRELLSRADAVGRELVARGVGRGDLVGVSAAKGWPQVVAVLGVTDIGAAYVPLDPDLPDARLQLLLDRTGTTHLVVDHRAAVRLASVPAVDRGAVCLHVVDGPDAAPATTGRIAPQTRRPTRAAGARDLAYVIFTSGSTGPPKGVMVDHGAAVNTVLDVNRRLGIDDRDRVLGLSSLSFDLSVWDVFGMLAAGGCLVLPDPGRAHDPGHWLRTAARGGVTVWNSVPALLGLAVDRAERVGAAGLPGVRLALLSGDWIPVDLPHRMRALVPPCTVVGLGGATEAAIWSIHHPTGSDPADGVAWTSVPYGRSLTRQWLAVLDSDGRRRPDWSAGELVIGGRGLATGYWREPALTADRFVPTRVGAAPGRGARMYRTGDIARSRPGGVIEFLGRDDGQVKINGFRVELGEIDAALLTVDGVANAAAVVLGPARGDRRLAAAVVPCADARLDPDDVRRALGSVLPAHQVPRRIVVVDAMPLSGNGKVDRRSLVELLGHTTPEGVATTAAVPTVAPPELVDRLARMWAEVLGVERVGPHDNFFALGGTSLVAVRLLAMLIDSLQVRLPMTTLFEEPTVARLASAVVEARRAGPALDGFEPWRASPDARHDPFPLTEVQQAYWIGRRPGLALGGVATHSYVELDLPELDVDRLDTALEALVARHDALRTVFRPDGLQQVLRGVPPYRITRAPVGAASASDLRARMSHQVQDPARWPLFEIAVSRPGASGVRLHVSVDLLIADAWSFRVLQRELLALYHGLALERQPGCTFRDYVQAARRARDGDEHIRARAYWDRRVAELPGPPPLPRPVGTVDAPARFERMAKRWDRERWLRLRRAGAERNLTPSGVLCAALAEVVAMWSQTSRFLLNLTTFNRMPLHPDVDRVVGDFTTTTILAVDASAPTFAGRAERMQAQIFRDLEHRSFSGIDVLRSLRRDPRRRAEVQAPVVFTSLLVPDRAPVSTAPAWDATVAFAVSQTPQVRLDVQVSEHDGDLVVTWDHLEDAFPPGVVREMFDAYSRLIDSLAGDSGVDYWEVGPAWTS